MSPKIIPPAFLRRILNPADDEISPLAWPGASSYYTMELSAADSDLDTSHYEHPEEFVKQLDHLRALSLDVGFVDLSPTNHWKKLAVLGTGAFGIVYLCAWYPYGKLNPILFAIKDCKNHFFFADYCSEGHITRRLNAAGCPNVVKVHEWLPLELELTYPISEDGKSGNSEDGEEDGEDEKEFHFRILYDFYPGGDVCRLFEEYFKHQVLIPEAFLWHIFHSMATAILFCANGHALPYVKPGWEEIVHKDVKPDNIFIGPHPPVDSDELYPNLFLADFGIAYTLPNDDVRDFKKHDCNEGTEGYIPPEAQKAYSPGELSSKIDIYALSRTIQNATDSIYEIYSPNELDMIAGLPNGDKFLPYSVALLELCDKCTSTDPDDRPEAYELWKQTGAMAEKWKQRTLNNRRKAREAGEPFYEGTVLFDRNVRLRVFSEEGLKNELLVATTWNRNDPLPLKGVKEWATNRWNELCKDSPS